MQILITHGHLARTRVLRFQRWQLVLAAAGLALALMLVSGGVYHLVFVTAAQARWPVVSQLVRWVVRDDLVQQERYVRENLEAMAQRVGELQARLVSLQVMGERVAGLAGVSPSDLLPADASATDGAKAEGSPAQRMPADGARPADPGGGTKASPVRAPEGAAASRAAPAPAGEPAGRPIGAAPDTPAPAGTAGAAPAGGLGAAARGGPFLGVPADAVAPTLSALDAALARLDEGAALSADVFAYIESRLLEGRLQALLVPSMAPVETYVGSGFGFRFDPFNGRRALHTGLDFPAPTGTPIVAAAGGVVVSADTHPEYGRLLVLDHGNGLVTRYAHASRILVAAGDIVRRGQVVAEVGSTGRSTGPHLHFEVLVDGVAHNPARFLARRAPAPQAGRAGGPPVLN